MAILRVATTRLSAQPVPRSRALYALPQSRAFRSTRHSRDETIEAPDHLSGAERAIFEKLKIALAPSELEVQDISGGCGSMYGLDIASPKFSGLSVIKQHKMVNQVLAEEIKGWHGVQLKTRAA